MEEAKNTDTETLWVITYSDGQLRSFTGTREAAEESARKEAAGRRWTVA